MWTEETIYQTADAFVSSGLAAAGYAYVNLDGCELAPCPDSARNETACHIFTRDAGGMLHDVDLQRLPRGAKAACDYIHGRGLLCGGYSDAAWTTCQGRPGSLFFEKQDAQMWANFGLDLFKVDNCGFVPPGYERPETRYPPLRDALNATGRPILFSLCVWGVDKPWLWGPSVGNTWRIYDDSDICDHTPGFGNGCWRRVLEIADAAVGLGRYAAPGGFNDWDILLVDNGGMTYAEDAAHFFLWVVAKSPLLLGNDVRSMGPDVRALLTAPGVLAVSGDPLGVGGDLVNRTCAMGGVEAPCSGGAAPPNSDKPIIFAAPCSDQRPSQVFSLAPAPYANASAGSSVVASAATGLCAALWDCASPVVQYACAPDPASCSGAAMRHFQWVAAPLGGGAAFQLRAVGAPGQCLATAQGELALAPCAPGGSAWSHTPAGQLVEAATGLCADAARPNASDPVDTWAVPLTGGARAALMLNRRSNAANITLNFTALGLAGAVQLESLFPAFPLGSAESSFTAEVEPHGAMLLKLSPAGAGARADDDGWRPLPPAGALERGEALRNRFYSSAPARREERQRRRREGK
jgi:hypothetical protein